MKKIVLWKDMIPVAFSNLLSSIYHIVDAIFIGIFLTVSMLAVNGVVSPVVMIFTGLILALNGGVSTIMAQTYRIRDDEVPRLVSTSFYFTMIVFGIGILIVFVGAPLLLKMLQVPFEIYHESLWYLRIYIFSFFFTALSNQLVQHLRVVGKLWFPVMTSIVSIVFGVVLNYILIPVFGIYGVAISTVVTSILLFIILMIYAYQKVWILRLKKVWLDRNTIYKITKIGLPMLIKQYLLVFANFILIMIVNQYTIEIISVFTFTNQLGSFLFQVGTAITTVVSIQVGYFYGKKQLEQIPQVYQAGWKTGFWFLLIVSVVLMIVSFPLIYDIFDHKDFIVMAIVILVIDVVFRLLSYPFLFSFNGVMKGIGKTDQSLYVSIVVIFLIRLPMLFLFPIFLGIYGVLIALGIGYLLQGLLGAWIYRNWERKNVLKIT